MSKNYLTSLVFFSLSQILLFWRIKIGVLAVDSPKKECGVELLRSTKL